MGFFVAVSANELTLMVDAMRVFFLQKIIAIVQGHQARSPWLNPAITPPLYPKRTRLLTIVTYLASLFHGVREGSSWLGESFG